MARPTKIRVGVVTAKEITPKRWQLRWRDPSSLQYVRHQLSGLDKAEVLKVMAHTSQEILSDRGFLPTRRATCPTIKDGILESIRLSGQRSYVRKDSLNRAALFLNWLRETHPNVGTWLDIRPKILQEYVNTMEARGLAHYTVRNHLRPIKQAWTFMVENYPDLVRPLPRIKQGTQPPREIECLEPSELKTLLDWLRERNPTLYAIAVLQSLAGLRVLEAVNLRRQDIDWTKGTVSVCDTPFHKVKTASSARTIPVVSEVLTALSEALERQRLIPCGGEIFVTPRGEPPSLDGINGKWRDWLRRAANETGLSRLREIPAHRLRSSFVTMASRLNVPDRLVQAYVGHSPRDVMGGHYRKITLADLGSVSATMERWRLLVDGQENDNKVATVSGE